MLRWRFPQLRLRPLQHGMRNKAGSVAIEFAMIAPMFFALMFASVEIGLVYFANMTLENGVYNAARLVRTGQVQQNGMSADDFRDFLCAEVDMLLSCDSGSLLIDVRSYSSFGTSGYEDAFDANGDLRGDLNSFQTGQSSSTSGSQDIVLVRAFYKGPLFTPMFAEYFSNMPNDGGHRLISSSFAFRNEPY